MSIKGVGAVNLDQLVNKMEQLNSGQANVSDNSNGAVNKVQDCKNEKVNEKQFRDAAEKLNKFLEDKKTHVEYEFHDKLKEVMFKIIDDNTGEVIKEVPSKKVLDMVAKMCELAGLLVDNKA